MMLLFFPPWFLLASRSINYSNFLKALASFMWNCENLPRNTQRWGEYDRMVIVSTVPRLYPFYRFICNVILSTRYVWQCGNWRMNANFRDMTVSRLMNSTTFLTSNSHQCTNPLNRNPWSRTRYSQSNLWMGISSRSCDVYAELDWRNGPRNSRLFFRNPTHQSKVFAGMKSIRCSKTRISFKWWHYPVWCRLLYG